MCVRAARPGAAAGFWALQKSQRALFFPLLDGFFRLISTDLSIHHIEINNDDDDK